MKILSLVIAALIFSSCAQQKIAEQKVEREVKEIYIPKNLTAAEEARELILKSTVLNEAQKQLLLALQEKAVIERAILKDEINKTRFLLIQTVLEPKMNKRELNILKKKIASLEKKRIENSFNLITEARDIIEPQKSPEAHQFNMNYLHHRYFEEI
jgi:hypothetical protein